MKHRQTHTESSLCIQAHCIQCRKSIICNGFESSKDGIKIENSKYKEEWIKRRALARRRNGEQVVNSFSNTVVVGTMMKKKTTTKPTPQMNGASRVSKYIVAVAAAAAIRAKKQTDQRDYNYFDFCMLNSLFIWKFESTAHQLCVFNVEYNPSFAL